MKRKTIALLLVGLFVSACADGSNDPSRSSASVPDSTSPGAGGDPTGNPNRDLASADEEIVISCFSNIFAAGHPQIPVGIDDGGILPTGWFLPPESERIVTFRTVTGTITPLEGYIDSHGPEGTKWSGTDIDSFGGISGVVHDRRQNFLVGVFLADEEPQDPAPRRLDFTKPARDRSLAPPIAQTFLIGDGKDYRFVVPANATRLFVGFAHARFGHGAPGLYGQCGGSLKGAIRVAQS